MGHFDRLVDRLAEIAGRNNGETNLNIKPKKETPVKSDDSTVSQGSIGHGKVRTGPQHPDGSGGETKDQS